MRKVLFSVLLGAILTNVSAQDTTINYKGQPPAAAMAPSLSAFGNDVCTVPVVGAISSTVFGISAGSMYTDANCERIKLARGVYDMGMKVAAVAIMCQDERVFTAMSNAGTPCPVDGKIGEQARAIWELSPERKPQKVKSQN